MKPLALFSGKNTTIASSYSPFFGFLITEATLQQLHKHKKDIKPGLPRARKDHFPTRWRFPQKSSVSWGKEEKEKWKREKKNGKEKWKGQATRAMSLALLDEENERPRGVFTKQI